MSQTGSYENDVVILSLFKQCAKLTPAEFTIEFQVSFVDFAIYSNGDGFCSNLVASGWLFN